jgi:hypothetical protein
MDTATDTPARRRGPKLPELAITAKGSNLPFPQNLASHLRATA